MEDAARSRMIEQSDLAYARLGDAHAEIMRRRFPGALIVKRNLPLLTPRRHASARRRAA